MASPAKRTSFRRQVLLGYGMATALTAVVLVWGLVNLLWLGQASNAILRENYRSILAAENMRSAVQRQETATVFLLLQTDLAIIEELSDQQQQFLLNLARAKDNITIPGEAEVLGQLEGDYNQYMFHFTRFVELPRTDTDEALGYYRKYLQPKVSAIERGCDRLMELNQEAMVAGSNWAQRIARTAVWSMLFVGCGAIVVGVLFSLILSTRISRPVRELVDATKRVAEGDYNVVVTRRFSDEFADLASYFNAMVAKLRVFHELRVAEILAEKKKNETILQTIDDGIVVVDDQRKVIALNAAAVNALGLTSAPLGQPDLREIVVDEGFCRAIETGLLAESPGTDEHGEQYVTLRRGGKERRYEYSITTVPAAGEKRVGVVVVLRDITRLWELDRMKSEFVMTASHELRTPLTSIEMSVGLLQERTGDRLEASEQELLRVAQEEVVRLKHLVNELLDLTKIESGKIEMQVTDVSARALLENAVEPFRAQAGERETELLLELGDDAPTVHCDPNKITWVLTNLVGNALRYTKPGGHVWLSAERAGHWIHLYVRDDGAGIPYAKQAAIFGKFVQVEESGEPGGAGLGLAIAKEIVRAHRGHIWVESEPGKGSLFIIALPV